MVVEHIPAKNLKRSHAASLAPIITRLQYRLQPLHPLPEGAPHPSFPDTLLHYHLLTEDQLDSMAVYYHQNISSPCIWTQQYPANMNWDAEFLRHISDIKGDEACIRIKRRKVGKFIGLRGCDTPIEEIDLKAQWERARASVAIKSPGEFAFRRGFKRW